MLQFKCKSNWLNETSPKGSSNCMFLTDFIVISSIYRYTFWCRGGLSKNVDSNKVDVICSYRYSKQHTWIVQRQHSAVLLFDLKLSIQCCMNCIPLYKRCKMLNIAYLKDYRVFECTYHLVAYIHHTDFTAFQQFWLPIFMNIFITSGFSIAVKIMSV